MASGVELIAEVDARYVCESINQSEKGLELATLFHFRRKTAVMCQVLGGVLSSCIFFFYLKPSLFLGAAIEMGDIKLLSDSVHTIH